MRRFWPLVIIALFAVIAVLFSQQRDTVSTENKTSTPQRIISIAPSITEMAFAIGLDEKIVGVSDYCDYPTATADLPKVGGFINPNIEAIVNLRPDLVLLYSNNGKLKARLDSLNIPSLAVTSTSIENIKTSIQNIGDVTGHHQQAQQVIDRFEQQIQRIHNKVKNETKPSVLLVMGHSKNSGEASTIFVAGQNDFYNDLINLAGGSNAFTNKSLKTGTLSQEGILSLNPDIIIDVFPEPDDHNYDLAKVTKKWQSLNQVNAVENGRVHLIEEDYATIPGPRLVLLLEQLATLFHPQLDWQSP